MKKLRQSIYQKLKNKKNKESSSRAIAEKLTNLEIFKKSTTIFCYMSLKNEVDTSLIIEKAFNEQKTVGVPRTGKSIEFVKISKDTVYGKGAFGVLEPISGEKLQNCDLIIVPMVAFDKNCNRMGHGKGYYDRYLADKNCIKIGVAFAEQEANFEVFPHDIAMDMVITAAKTYFKSE